MEKDIAKGKVKGCIITTIKSKKCFMMCWCDECEIKNDCWIGEDDPNTSPVDKKYAIIELPG